MDELDGFEAELMERPLRPSDGSTTLGPCTGRLRHQQPASDLEQGSGTFGDHGRPAEGTGQCPVESGSQAWLAPAHLRPLLEYRVATGQPEALDRRAEEGGAAAVGLQQIQSCLGPFGPQHQPRQPTSRAQVHEPEGSFWRKSAGKGDKALGVLDLWLEWAGSQEPRGASLHEELVQQSGGVAPVIGAGHRRRISPQAR
jgi:hypothetical protein